MESDLRTGHDFSENLDLFLGYSTSCGGWKSKVFDSTPKILDTFRELVLTCSEPCPLNVPSA